MSQNIFPITVPLTVGTNDVTIPLNVDNNDVAIPLGTDSDIRPMPDITIGEVETLATGEDAYATMTGTSTHPVLNLGLPEGPEGPPGQDYNLTQADREEIAGIVEDDMGGLFVPVTTGIEVGGKSTITNYKGDVTTESLHKNLLSPSTDRTLVTINRDVEISQGISTGGVYDETYKVKIDNAGSVNLVNHNVYIENSTNSNSISFTANAETAWIHMDVGYGNSAGIDGLSAPVYDTEAANKKYVDDAVSGVDVGVTSFNGATGAVTYTAPVTSVNGQTGAVTLNIPTVPTNVSSFNNDAGYLTLSTLPVYNGGVS